MEAANLQQQPSSAASALAAAAAAANSNGSSNVNNSATPTTAAAPVQPSLVPQQNGMVDPSMNLHWPNPVTGSAPSTENQWYGGNAALNGYNYMANYGQTANLSYQ